MDSDGVGRVSVSSGLEARRTFGYAAFERASGLVVYTYYWGLIMSSPDLVYTYYQHVARLLQHASCSSKLQVLTIAI